MSWLRKVLRPIDRRIDWRVDRRIEELVLPHFPRYDERAGTVETVAEEFSATAEKLLFTMSELRRWMVDDLDASNEAATLLGQSLARLQAAVDGLGRDLERVQRRLDALEPDGAGAASVSVDGTPGPG